MSTNPAPRIFMDPVHGSIELEWYLVKIIDTSQFQRLRKIKQSGGKCYVYPGATHTRFQHSIGVCHIASELIKELNKPEKMPTGRTEPWISKEEAMCIKIAALCHDIGHGPFSHVYDSAVKTYFETLSNDEEKKEFTGGSTTLLKEASHEHRSAAIVENLLRTKLKEEFEKFQQMESFVAKFNIYIKLIQDMITFSEEHKDKRFIPIEAVSYEGKEKSYLFEIVANGFTGIDVDKMDYFTRDSRSVGLSNSFDWRRYTQTAMIIQCPDGFHHICSREKDAVALYELFHTRNVLHRTVYQHKTALLIEYMIKQALIKASHVRCSPLNLSILQCWRAAVNEDDPFLELTDDLVEHLIMKNFTVVGNWVHERSSTDIGILPDDDAAREWLQRIKTRSLYKCLGHTKTEEQKEKFEHEVRDLSSGSIIKEKAKFDYGKGTENPMDLHYFYSKPEAGQEQVTVPPPFNLPKEEVSAFLPENFKEAKLFWYLDVTKPGNDKKVAKLKRFLKNLTDKRRRKSV